MDSLIFSLNAVAPIILLVALGYMLKKIGWMTVDFAKKTHKLVFHVFLPAMLFLNVYKIEHLGSMDPTYIIYVVVVLLLVFLLGLPLVLAVARKPAYRGALMQAIFRSNYALIGIPLASSLFGEEGVTVATLLSAVSVPALNVLAVIALTIFRTDGGKVNAKSILLGIVQNPLIVSVLAGLCTLGIRALFVQGGISFRLSDIEPLYKALSYLSNLATPLALLALGAQFEFSAVAALRREILFGTLMRTVLVPLFAIGGAWLLFADRFGGAHFAAFIAMFATPVSISSVPMAQEMKADATLAGQLVVWSTLTSALTIFLFTFFLRLGGIF
ncbi:MAG: AEC family transporter [Clostridia bacterium]|nr:AEC family transporter [Clostridia bacterium]